MKSSLKPRCLAAKLVLSLVCTLALGVNPILAAAATPEPWVVDADFQPAVLSKTMLKVSDTAALKGLKRVAVAQFSVEFVTRDNVSAQTSSFGAAGRSSVSGYYKLVGVSEPDFQALTEALHAGFLRDLQAAGLEVVSTADVMAAPTWRKLSGGGVALPQRGDSAVTVGPLGMAIYGWSRVNNTGVKQGAFAAVTSMSAGFGAVGAAMDNVELQKELGQAVVLEVNLQVHFAQLTNNKRGFFGAMASQASVSHKIHPIVTHAKMSVMSGPTLSMVEVPRPLLLNPTAFSELRKEAKTTADVAGAVAVGLLRMAIGSKDSSSYETFEAVADPARYRDLVGSGLGLVNAMFVARLIQDR